jgi:hypothetical protein
MEKRLPRLIAEFSQNPNNKQWCASADRAILLVKSVNLTACNSLAALDMGHPAVEMNNTNPLYQRDVVILNVGCGMGAGEFKTLAILAADSLNIGMEKQKLPSFKQITTQLASLKEVRPARQTQGPSDPITINHLSYEFSKERPTADGLLSQISHQRQGRYVRASGSNSASNSASDSASTSQSDSSSDSSSQSGEGNSLLCHIFL